MYLWTMCALLCVCVICTYILLSVILHPSNQTQVWSLSFQTYYIMTSNRNVVTNDFYINGESQCMITWLYTVRMNDLWIWVTSLCSSFVPTSSHFIITFNSLCIFISIIDSLMFMYWLVLSEEVVLWSLGTLNLNDNFVSYVWDLVSYVCDLIVGY